MAPVQQEKHQRQKTPSRDAGSGDRLRIRGCPEKIGVLGPLHTDRSASTAAPIVFRADGIIRRMRRRAACAACILALVGGLAAADLLDASRVAVTGGRARPALQTLSMNGRLRVAADDGTTLDGTVAIRIALPRRFVRIDTIGATRRVSGFDGDRLLTRSDGRPADRLKLERAQLTRLLLGAAAIVVADERVDIRAAGEEAFPDTRALDLTTRSWSVRYVMDAASALPLRLVYFAPQRGTTITSFADRRDVDGYLLPHRITTTTAERVLETLMLDEMMVNPRLTDADFKP
jgi:hypothetical protein